MSMEEETPHKPAGDAEKVEVVNPLLAIWFHPRKALLYAWQVIPEDYIHRLYMVAGLLFMLAIRVPDWLAITPNPIGVMIQVLLVGPVGGIVVGYLYAACLRMVGNWMGASVPSKYSKCTVAWGQLPFAAFWAMFLLVYGLLDSHQSLLYKDVIWLCRDFLGWIPLMVAAPLLIWGIVIRLRSISILLGFGLPRTVATWLLTILLAYVPGVAFVTVYGTLYFITASGAQ